MKDPDLVVRYGLAVAAESHGGLVGSFRPGGPSLASGGDDKMARLRTTATSGLVKHPLLRSNYCSSSNGNR